MKWCPTCLVLTAIWTALAVVLFHLPPPTGLIFIIPGVMAVLQLRVALRGHN